MAWTETTRPKYRRDGLAYASHTTDEEWALIEPHLPPPAPCGRSRKTSLRDVVNAIFFIAQTGCQWRMLPKKLWGDRREARHHRRGMNLMDEPHDPS